MCKYIISFVGNDTIYFIISTLVSFYFYLFIFFLNFGTLVHVFQVSGYTFSQPSTTASASLTTSTTGNFDFLSPLILVGRASTGRVVGWGINANCKTLSWQVDGVSCIILLNSPAYVSETNVAGRIRWTLLVVFPCRLELLVQVTTVLYLYYRANLKLLVLAQSFQKSKPGCQVSIYTNGVKDRNSSLFFDIVNLDIGNTGVPVFGGTSPNSYLNDNVANEQNLNVIPPNLLITVTQQPVVPIIFYQS